MNKKILLIFGFIFILSFTLVSAIELTDIFYKISVEYEPNCDTLCENITISNITIPNCTTNCFGKIKILGEEENHLTIIEDLSDLTSKRIYTGFYQADIGNSSDISNIFDKLDEYMICNDKLNNCMDSNREIDTKLMMCNRSSGYMDNFTACDLEKNRIQSQLDTKTNSLSTKDEEIENAKGERFVWGIGGLILCYILIKIVGPKIEGTETPKDESEKQFPPNEGY